MVELIKRSEGFRGSAYRCAGGQWTVGYGTTRGVFPGLSVSEREAEQLLREDLGQVCAGLERLVARPLAQHQFDALCSFVYNVGEGAFARSTLLKLVNAGQDEAVAHEFDRWVFANGLKLPGLVARRNAEARLWAGQTPAEGTASLVEGARIGSPLVREALEDGPAGFRFLVPLVPIARWFWKKLGGGHV